MNLQACLLALFAFASALSVQAASKPNILWLVSEDNDPLLGCYGDPLARTPTLDKLAREGVVYERCFAAQGCTMLAEKAGPAEQALQARLEDPSGAVQVAAAEALARLGQRETALPVLERWLKRVEAPWVGLQAANTFAHLGESARPSLPALREALARVAEAEGAANPLQFQRRILERTIAELDGRAMPLVYPTIHFDRK